MPLFIDTERLDSNSCTVKDLLSFPLLVEKSKNFASQPPRHLSNTDKVLYVHQREFGSVKLNDKNIKFIGSTDATTCHIIVCESDVAASVGHFDGCDTESGLEGMLKQHVKLHKVSNNEDDIPIKVHIIGGFDDDCNISVKLLESILAVLWKCPFNAQLLTLCTYTQNTKIVNGENVPAVCGVVYDLNSRNIFPATFGDKGPSSVLRNARIFGGSKKMLSIYKGIEPVLEIGPFKYSVFGAAYIIPQLPADDVLKYCSTSPHCEPEDFVETTKAAMKFLTDNPDPWKVFPKEEPLKYVMNEYGQWVQLKS